jgi:hypothetical protein
MEERVYEIRWNLYRNSAGAWVVFSDTPATYTTENRTNMESWLTARGLRPDELEKLFRDAEEKGEGLITLSLKRVPHD